MRAAGFKAGLAYRALAATVRERHDYEIARLGDGDIVADGFDDETVSTVIRLVDRAEWKRRQYPLGPKVSALAFGRDRRRPVTGAFRE